MDKLRAMTFFCRAVESKSLAAAAKALDVVPSALSKAISALEKDLTFALLNRSTRGLSLTEEGALYYERCRQIIADVEAAESIGRSRGKQARGTLRLGMHPALRYAMMTTLRPLIDGHPDLKVETVITNAAASVVSDGLDVMLHIGAMSDSSLIARPLGWTRPVVCAAPRYLEARGQPRHPSELADHGAVIYARRDEAPNTRWRFLKGDESCDVNVPVRVISRDGIGLVDVALSGCAVARPLEIAARHLIAGGELRVVLNEWTGEPQAISAVMPAARAARAGEGAGLSRLRRRAHAVGISRTARRMSCQPDLKAAVSRAIRAAATAGQARCQLLTVLRCRRVDDYSRLTAVARVGDVERRLLPIADVGSVQ